MELGTYGWGTNVEIFRTNVLFIIPPAPSSSQYGVLNIGSGIFDGLSTGTFVGSTSGTEIGINAPSGFTGNLLDLQTAGSSKFKVDASGNITVAGTITSAGITTMDASKITTGTVSTARGGTGLNTSAATNGQLLIGNGSGLALAALTQNYGTTITNGAGTIGLAVNLTNSITLKGTADTTMTSAGTFSDGPTVTVGAGTWLLIASTTVASPSGSAMRVTGKLWDGTTVISSAEESNAAVTSVVSTVSICLAGTVVSAGATYKMSVTSTTASCLLKETTPDNSAGNNASWITAVRLA